MRGNYLAATIAGAGGSLASCTGSGNGGGDEYPNQTIRFIIPFDPGESVDFLSRSVLATVLENLGMNVELQNVSDGGNPGFEEPADSDSDGYTLAHYNQTRETLTGKLVSKASISCNKYQSAATESPLSAGCRSKVDVMSKYQDIYYES